MRSSKPVYVWLIPPILLVLVVLVFLLVGVSVFPVRTTVGPPQDAGPTAGDVVAREAVVREPSAEAAPWDLGLAPTGRSAQILWGVSALLVVIVSLGVVRPAAKRWSHDTGGSHSLTLRFWSLAITYWLALSVFITFDVLAAVSVRPLLTLCFAAFWLVLGLLLLHATPVRLKLLILCLFAFTVVSVRWVNWNSRKPFLRDLARVEIGMPSTRVDEVMGGYRTWVGAATTLGTDGEVVSGSVLYHHTREGWGNVDVGNVVYGAGRVVRKSFSPD